MEVKRIVGAWIQCDTFCISCLLQKHEIRLRFCNTLEAELYGIQVNLGMKFSRHGIRLQPTGILG